MPFHDTVSRAKKEIKIILKKILSKYAPIVMVVAMTEVVSEHLGKTDTHKNYNNMTTNLKKIAMHMMKEAKEVSSAATKATTMVEKKVASTAAAATKAAVITAAICNNKNKQSSKKINKYRKHKKTKRKYIK